MWFIIHGKPFKDVNNFKEISVDSMHKKLQYFHKNFDGLKNVSPQRKEN